MLNTRLQERLTESEILKIFSDTVEVSKFLEVLNDTGLILITSYEYRQ